MIPPAWQPALAAVQAAPLTLVIGESNAGKTTLITALANALVERGASVGIVDADLGQSEIGPPTTVGLGRVARPVARLADAERVSMHFVGVTTPAAAMLALVVAVRRAVDRARDERFVHVIVDTSGLVNGELGRALKQAKIDVLDPDLVIALERECECEPIVAAYAGARRPAQLRLPALGTRRGRSAEDRRRFRERALGQHFAAAGEVALDLRHVRLRTPPLYTGTPLDAAELQAVSAAVDCPLTWVERRHHDAVVIAPERPGDAPTRALTRLLSSGPVITYALADLEGRLAGLDDDRRRTLGLGVVRRLDPVGRALTVATAVTAQAVAAVTIGRERYPA